MQKFIAFMVFKVVVAIPINIFHCEEVL